jgi:branched-chain amino acid transport system ATP-binding protein
MTPVLACRELRAGYDGAAVVRGLDLSVQAGEVVALLGPNGAGKTTTLLTLAGVLPAIGGSVELLGEPVTGGRPHLVARRGLSLVPDDRAVFFGLTVRQNLRLGRRGGSAEDRILELFPELEPRLGMRAGLLSGGEQQMLALGRALLAAPRILLVDELSLGLAPVIVQRLLPVLRHVADEDGVAVLVVEQHVALALGAADRAYVLNHGALILEGAAADLAARPDLLRESYLGQAAFAGDGTGCPSPAAPR